MCTMRWTTRLAGFVSLMTVGCGVTLHQVDPVQFCTDKRMYVCARDNRAGRIDMSQYNQCVAQIDAMCAGFSFNGCVPTPAQADACLAALADVNRVTTPDGMIIECMSSALCGWTDSGTDQ